MVDIIYPLKAYYQNMWYKDKMNDKEFILNYVRNAMESLHYTDEKSCNLQNGIVQRVRIINQLGQKFQSGTSHIDICIPIEVSQLPTDVILTTIGDISIFKFKPIGTWGIIYNLIQSAVRAINVMGMIAVVFDIRPMLASFKNVGSMFNMDSSKIGGLVGKTIEGYQRSIAYLDEKIYLSYMYKFHKLTRAISPDYDDYWKAKEQRLHTFSGAIFGNTTQLNQYVGFASLTYRIMIENTDKDEEEKRHATLTHEAKIIARIQSKLHTYQLAPSRVYSDLMYYSIEEGNKYRSEAVVIRGYELYADILSMKDNAKFINEKLTTLGVYDKALEGITIKGMSNSIQLLSSTYTKLYNNELKPAFNILQTIVDKQTKEINALKKFVLDNMPKLNRAMIITSNPDSLKPFERIIQDNQFIKTMDNAISGTDSIINWTTKDIKDYINAKR